MRLPIPPSPKTATSAHGAEANQPSGQADAPGADSDQDDGAGAGDESGDHGNDRARQQVGRAEGGRRSPLSAQCPVDVDAAGHGENRGGGVATAPKIAQSLASSQ